MVSQLILVIMKADIKRLALTLLGLATLTSGASLRPCQGPRCLAEVEIEAGAAATPAVAAPKAVEVAAPADPTKAAPVPTTEKGVRFRGVNLGGWLVLESWMYPDWWKTTGVDVWVGEWQFCQKLGQKAARLGCSFGMSHFVLDYLHRKLLEKHWDTWVTKKDLMDLKSAGIDHLRIPIGYWILGAPYLKEGEPYVTGGWKYLERALGWAKELGLKVTIDLHGAPGSQNGHDNCGFSGGMEVIHWHEPKNLARTNEILTYLAKNLTATNNMKQYKDVIQGLCILNEPWTQKVGGPITLDEVKDWAQTAVDAVLAAGWKGDIWYPDGFDLGWEGWRDFLRPPEYKNVFIDTHLYYFFDPSLTILSADELADKACTGYYRQQLENAKDISSGVIVGEWSQDFKAYPMGFPMDAETLAAHQRFFLAQAEAYGEFSAPGSNHVKGGFFWSFKSKGRVEKHPVKLEDNNHSGWDYLALWKDGIAPKDLAQVTQADLVCPKGDGQQVIIKPGQTGGQDPNLPPEGGGQ